MGGLVSLKYAEVLAERWGTCLPMTADSIKKLSDGLGEVKLKFSLFVCVFTNEKGLAPVTQGRN